MMDNHEMPKYPAVFESTVTGKKPVMDKPCDPFASKKVAAEAVAKFRISRTRLA